MDGDDAINFMDLDNDAVSDNFISNDCQSNDVIIEKGRVFNSFEEAEKLYHCYANNKGFGVRRRNSRVDAIQLVCTREGFSKPKKEIGPTIDKSDHGASRLTKSTRIGCSASLHCALDASTKLWRVTKFDDFHNHEMVTPKSKKYLRSHKIFTTTAKDLSEVFESQGISVGKVVNVLKTGEDDVEFTKKDCYNHITALRRKILDDGDANAVHKYCIRQQQEDPNFRYAISIDSDDRLTNFFWIDARSRIAYQVFGDVVSFDTTYRTNKYDMSFAPFVGVNNHLQTIIFGCALLQDETEESFIWLFEAWLEAMDGKHPISFITDQDTAMMNAVAKVFPKTKHRLCLWHITKKFPERLSHIYHDNSSFKTDLNQCIHESISTQEFETSWRRLVIQYNLIENDWLEKLYSMRDLWVPCFNKNVFFGGMNTTGRSESINSFFDKFIKSGMTLKELVLKCEEALDSRYEAFRRAEFDSKHKVPILTLDMELENHGGSVYTSEIFKLFHNELKSILGCKREKLSEESTRETYKVRGAHDPKQGFIVEYDTCTKESSCECMLFTFKGILCKHILSVFYVHNVDRIPSNYIMSRWTKDVVNPIFVCKVASRVRLRTSMESFELNESVKEMYNVCDSSSHAIKFFKEEIDKLVVIAKHRFGDSLNGATGNGSREEDNNNLQQIQSSHIHDPNVTQTKGRKRASKGKVTRIVGGLEEASENKNRCSVCSKTSHNKRRCPELRNQL